MSSDDLDYDGDARGAEAGAGLVGAMNMWADFVAIQNEPDQTKKKRMARSFEAIYGAFLPTGKLTDSDKYSLGLRGY